MPLPMPGKTPDPNIDQPELPTPVPEQEPHDPAEEPTPVGDPPAEEPPIKAGR